MTHADEDAPVQEGGNPESTLPSFREDETQPSVGAESKRLSEEDVSPDIGNRSGIVHNEDMESKEKSTPTVRTPEAENQQVD